MVVLLLIVKNPLAKNLTMQSFQRKNTHVKTLGRMCHMVWLSLSSPNFFHTLSWKSYGFTLKFCHFATKGSYLHLPFVCFGEGKEAFWFIWVLLVSLLPRGSKILTQVKMARSHELRNAWTSTIQVSKSARNMI